VIVLLTVTVVYTALYLKQSLYIMTVTLGGNDYETDSSCHGSVEELRLLVQQDDQDRFQVRKAWQVSFVKNILHKENKSFSVPVAFNTVRPAFV